jgi:polyhydroxyalkanoate synthase subunit PhaE
MSNHNPFAPENALALGQQFWQNWTDFAHSQASQAGKTSAGAMPMPNWHEGLEFWSRLTGKNPSHDAAHAIEQMTAHGQRLMQMLQAIAQQIGEGKQVSAGDFSRTWKELLGGGNPMLDTLRTLSAQGAQGWEQLMQGVEPVLAQLRGERNTVLGMPAFGLGRERQEHLQSMLAAQATYAEKLAAYTALLSKTGERGLEYFEAKLAERSEPGRQLDSMRAVYDLWIDAAEEAYAESALSPEFRRVYGEMVNAQMRVKQLMQHELDHQLGQLGLPNRSEVDGAHRKIHAMQRELRELREQLRELRTGPPVATATAARSASVETRKATPTRSKTATNRASTAAKSAARTSKPAAKSARPAVKTPKRAAAKSAAPVTRTRSSKGR